MEDPFVTTGWLAAHLSDPNLIVVDGSWHMPATGRNPRVEFLAGHIPGAVFFDIDGIADKTTDLPHMLPAPEDFARMVGALGIGDGMTIVVYDELGLQSAPRVRWSLLAMGATDVRILAGGGPKWRAEGRPIEAGEAKRAAAIFTPRFDPSAVADLAQVRGIIANGGKTIVDARPGPRFKGEVAEPRPNLRQGHMPGALNAPFPSLVENGTLKPVSALKAAFDSAGVDIEKPIVTSCGSGITAAIVALALQQVGAKDVAVYDGSWAEWGGRDDTPVER